MSVSIIIDGKKCELEAPAHRANLQAGVTLLALGDYKAKLVQDLRTRRRMSLLKPTSFSSPTKKPGSSSSWGRPPRSSKSAI